jgi:hypothetical protein
MPLGMLTAFRLAVLTQHEGECLDEVIEYPRHGIPHVAQFRPCSKMVTVHACPMR